MSQAAHLIGGNTIQLYMVKLLCADLFFVSGKGKFRFVNRDFG
jgi:hypothetical protein